MRHTAPCLKENKSRERRKSTVEKGWKGAEKWTKGSQFLSRAVAMIPRSLSPTEQPRDAHRFFQLLIFVSLLHDTSRRTHHADADGDADVNHFK